MYDLETPSSCLLFHTNPIDWMNKFLFKAIPLTISIRSDVGTIKKSVRVLFFCFTQTKCVWKFTSQVVLVGCLKVWFDSFLFHSILILNCLKLKLLSVDKFILIWIINVYWRWLDDDLDGNMFLFCTRPHPQRGGGLSNSDGDSSYFSFDLWMLPTQPRRRTVHK